MKVRVAAQVLLVLSLGLLLVGTVSALQPTDGVARVDEPLPEGAPAPVGGAPVTMAVREPVDGDPSVVRVDLSGHGAEPQQVGADIRRLHTVGFEGSEFPPKDFMRAVDANAAFPGFFDDIEWNRAPCKGSVGETSAWSVGGGSIGAGYTCGQDVPASRGVNSQLQFVPLDFGNVPGCLRVTFDYWAKMPEGALFVGAGDFEDRDPEGRMRPITGWRTLTADTGGQWERGKIFNFDNTNNVSQVMMAFIYQDPVDQSGGPGETTPGTAGAYIDNVLLDAVFRKPCSQVLPFGSPTAPPSPTPTRTKTPLPPTATDIVLTLGTPKPTKTPIWSRKKAAIPIALIRSDIGAEIEPPPTVPSATATKTPLPTDTNTPLPPTNTNTPPPSSTPTPPPTPTRTPVPRPDVRISDVRPFTLGAVDLEWVRVKNQGTGSQDMTGWFVTMVRRAKDCEFPDGLILDPGDQFEVRMGPDAEDGVRTDPQAGEIDGVACDKRFLLNNHWDEAQLWDRFDPVDKFCYDEFGEYPCP